MTEPNLREPEQIRQGYVGKPRNLGCFGGDWAAGLDGDESNEDVE